MRFSVIMPTYGQGAFIEESIRSVLGQEEVYLELLVRDAWSTDETPTILCKYARDRRLQVVRKSDEGQVDALNQGLS